MVSHQRSYFFTLIHKVFLILIQGFCGSVGKMYFGFMKPNTTNDQNLLFKFCDVKEILGLLYFELDQYTQGIFFRFNPFLSSFSAETLTEKEFTLFFSRFCE